jgi:hypothetical protein
MLDFPINILVSIITDWLDINSLGRYDAALCNRTDRASYLEVLRSSEVTMPGVWMCYAMHDPCAILVWVAERSVRVKSMNFWGLPNDWEEAKVTAFLAAVGNSLEDVEMHEVCGPDIDILCEQTILLCPRLRQLHIVGCAPRDSQGISLALQKYAATLSSLRIEKSAIPLITAPMLMPAMQHLSIIAEGRMDAGNIPRLIRNCPNLLSFKLLDDGYEVNTDNPNNLYLTALAESCPKLQRICCKIPPNCVGTFIQLMRNCADLHTVDIQHGADGDAAAINATLRHCRKLRALRVQHMPEASIPLLATRMLQLEHLSLVHLHCHTAASLELVAANCGNLKSFDLHLCASPGEDASSEEAVPTGPYPPESAFQRLLASLSQVETLDLAHAKWMTDGIMLCIAAHCKCLRDLALHGTEPSLEAFTAVVQQCAQLRTVYHSKHDKTLGRDAGDNGHTAAWLNMRPGLTINSCDEPTFGYWGTGVFDLLSIV